MQVVIADDKPAGFFLEVWKRLSEPHPLLSLRQQPFPNATCFKHAIISPYVGAGQSLLTYLGPQDVSCHSEVLHATALWLRHLFDELSPDHARQHLTAPEPYELTGIGRELAGAATRIAGRVQHFGRDIWRRRVRDASSSSSSSPTQNAGIKHMKLLWLSRAHHEALHSAALTDWQRARVVPNEPDIIMTLQQAVLDWNSHSCLAQQQQQRASQPQCRPARVFFDFEVREQRVGATVLTQAIVFSFDA